jgi:hypothetical protein
MSDPTSTWLSVDNIANLPMKGYIKIRPVNMSNPVDDSLWSAAFGNTYVGSSNGVLYFYNLSDKFGYPGEWLQMYNVTLEKNSPGSPMYGPYGYYWTGSTPPPDLPQKPIQVPIVEPSLPITTEPGSPVGQLIGNIKRMPLWIWVGLGAIVGLALIRKSGQK